MPLDRNRCRPLLQSFDFRNLFIEELGWDGHKAALDVALKEASVRLESISHKRGFVVWQCVSPAGGKFPDSAARRRIEREATKAAHEHLIIFTDAAKTRQVWQWVRREPGKPLRVREIEWNGGQSGEIILQKLDPLFVSIDDEEALTLLDVTGRAGANVDERVTKKFYEEFRKQHGLFLKFITGIPNQGDHEWYASVMLNRLMFVYFVQKKGFLDGDTDYLRNRLTQLKAKNKGDKFYSFYRAFLLRLFHEGLGGKGRKGEIEKLIGRVPYLNGGIFDVHQLERDYGDAIQIPDKAFEAVFDYFDNYQWHLDERPLRNDNEINPDVLGYIFEKYINQKQMGAYYTKEDITEYIGKSCIIPFLFDSAKSKCKVAFENADGPTIWDLLRENPDRYIYPSVRQGCDLPLPMEIAAGLDTKKPNLIERRKPWNKAAPEEYALPTEIWRETVARRQRYEEVRAKLANGEVLEINDFITLNLDLRQFAQDVIGNCEGPDLLMAFWQAISSITVLDPTGGSGAFIFAALNILEPLYEGCLDRMEGFLAEWGENGKKTHPNYHKKFTEVLARVATHPNRRYFVLKSIILNNLYAVDIMEEAVEICKLRLFLKLAALVEPDETKDNYGIEPLPDIDFNIRAGNTLVGYATYDEVKRAITSGLDFDNAMEKIAVKAADLQQTFDKFRQLQTEGDGSVPAAHKLELQKRLKALEDELNRHLAGEYGVKFSDKAAYAQWVKSHQPFHWFIQFYGILHGGGFDVIIGNPPYVEYTKVEATYRVIWGETLSTNNLFALVSERSRQLINCEGSLGLILPNSSVSAEKMKPLQHVFRQGAKCWVSNFAWRPSKLFDGANMLLAIWLVRLSPKAACYSTRYHRWQAEYRDVLFPTLQYADATDLVTAFRIPKLPGPLAVSIIEKCRQEAKGDTLLRSVSGGAHNLYYFRAVLYWFKVLIKPPVMLEDGVQTPTGEMKELSFAKKVDRDAALAIMASNLFALNYVVWSSCQVVNSPDLMFPVSLKNLTTRHGEQLSHITARLIRDVDQRSEIQTRNYSARGRSFVMKKQYFYFKESKPILDEIDTVLANHYGFTAEELDFILNYDIKYRLGRGAGEEEDT
jgi:hypothetical protein